MFGLFPRRWRHRSFLTIALCSLCLCLGWGFALGLQPMVAQTPPMTAASDAVGTVDPVAPAYKKGQELYLKNCATCHIALPPAVLPSQTWTNLLQDKEHYGVQLPDIRRFDVRLMARYLNTYSRSLRVDEQTPYRVTRARYFYALHPQVKLPRPVKMESCASCHPKANVFNFREWQESGE